ncbi:hypothetical protein GCM10009801_03320 [Streptomyces albiaxialis]|uniref:Sigma-like protein n=1 Tax=Streptomyces albiaxialis TaxID=329523 RepID=A0ABP5H1P2_9ACTN
MSTHEEKPVRKKGKITTEDNHQTINPVKTENEEAPQPGTDDNHQTTSPAN